MIVPAGKLYSIASANAQPVRSTAAAPRLYSSTHSSSDSRKAGPEPVVVLTSTSTPKTMSVLSAATWCTSTLSRFVPVTRLFLEIAIGPIVVASATDVVLNVPEVTVPPGML